jgi:cytoskeletal protein CcmA (bactofilin family)
MFGKSRKKEIVKDRSMGKGDIKAFLGEGASFEGKLVFDEIVRLDGNFSGEVTSKGGLIIGATAMVTAEVEVEELTISGRFKGNIRARSKVELKKPAQVEGNIETPVLSIEEGVVLNGTVSMGGHKSNTDKSTTKTAESPQ